MMPYGGGIMIEFIDKYLFNATVETILLSALTAIIFAGGTNYILQKTNRKGNLLAEKGFLIMSKIIEIENERNRTLSKTLNSGNIINLGNTTNSGNGKSLNEIRISYSKIYFEFKNFIEIHSFLLNKSCNEELQIFLKYVEQPLKSLDNMLNGESATFNVSKEFGKNLSKEIIKLIQKQMV